MRLFGAARLIEPADLVGRTFLGEVLKVNFSVIGSRALIANVGWFGDLVKFPIPRRNRFFEMRFDSDSHSGINYWPARGEILPFQMYEDSDRASLVVDYSVPANLPVLQRPYLDEIRRTPDGTLIGKFYYRVAGIPVLFLWFSLVEIV